MAFFDQSNEWHRLHCRAATTGQHVPAVTTLPRMWAGTWEQRCSEGCQHQNVPSPRNAAAYVANTAHLRLSVRNSLWYENIPISSSHSSANTAIIRTLTSLSLKTKPCAYSLYFRANMGQIVLVSLISPVDERINEDCGFAIQQIQTHRISVLKEKQWNHITQTLSETKKKCFCWYKCIYKFWKGSF